MTDEQIDRKILDALATVRSPEAWTALTFESGPYSINRVRHWATALVRAILNETDALDEEAQSTPAGLTDAQIVSHADNIANVTVIEGEEWVFGRSDLLVFARTILAARG